MDAKTFKKLLESAKNDPKFFHSLVFEPEKALASVNFISRRAKGKLISAHAGELLARLVGLQACGNTCTSSCDNTCGQSCGFTTNFTEREQLAEIGYFSRIKEDVMECGNTCTSSCDNTCGQSCGFTTNFSDFGRDRAYY